MEIEFEGTALTVLSHRGQPAWIVREVGRALGYDNNGKALIDTLRRRWSDELEEGRDWLLVERQEFEGAKMTPSNRPDGPSGPEAVPHAKFRRTTLVFESGLHGILLLSRQPRARAMRKWLRDEVMPQLARDGRYDPRRGLADIGAEPAPPLGPVGTPASLEELRLRLSAIEGLDGPEARRLRLELARLGVVGQDLQRPIPASARRPAPASTPAPTVAPPAPPPLALGGEAPAPRRRLFREPEVWSEEWSETRLPTAAERSIWRFATQEFPRPWAEEDIQRDRWYHEARRQQEGVHRPGRRTLAERWGLGERSVRRYQSLWGWATGGR